MIKEKKEHRIFQISQKALFYDPNEKKFILFRPAEIEGGRFYKTYGPWDMVGGRIDAKGESIDEALKREIKEEAGEEIQYNITEVLGRVEMEYSFGPVMTIGFLAIYTGGEIVLSDEHTEWRKATAEEIEKDEEIKPWLKEFVKIAEERLQANEYLNDLKRLQADFENYKKRQVESQKDLRGMLIEKLVLDIIPVLDNFRSATAHVPPEQKESPWVVGIQYIEKQLETVLTDNGVQVIEVKEGDVFDPSVHEALDTEESSKEQVESTEEHKIAKVIQNGYKFGDRVIRPAKVIVR